jgi:hypothetical protein
VSTDTMHASLLHVCSRRGARPGTVHIVIVDVPSPFVATVANARALNDQEWRVGWELLPDASVNFFFSCSRSSFFLLVDMDPVDPPRCPSRVASLS